MPPFDHFSVIAPLYARAVYSKVSALREYASLPVKGKLLDVGGGTGRASSRILNLVDEVVITDISFGMLREAHRSPLRPVCGGSESLPFADDSFERIIMVDALHHVIDQRVSAYEMFRVLKPGGVLVIEEPDIRTFGIKLIAIVEKFLLMRSHFLAPDQIMGLFVNGKKRCKAENGTVWVIIQKQVTLLA